MYLIVNESFFSIFGVFVLRFWSLFLHFRSLRAPILVSFFGVFVLQFWSLTRYYKITKNNKTLFTIYFIMRLGKHSVIILVLYKRLRVYT